MNERGDLDGPAENLSTEPLAEAPLFERIILRLLRNILVLSILLLGPAFWFYRLAGAMGFVFGAAISYVNFRSLSRGVEGLTKRIVDQNSSERGGRIIMRFVLRYLLVGVVAYAIFKSSAVAFRGFLWGLLIPAAALMLEAAWESYMALRRRV